MICVGSRAAHCQMANVAFCFVTFVRCCVRWRKEWKKIRTWFGDFWYDGADFFGLHPAQKEPLFLGGRII